MSFGVDLKNVSYHLLPGIIKTRFWQVIENAVILELRAFSGNPVEDLIYRTLCGKEKHYGITCVVG